ncbi:hypothetical protein HG530_005758 [Fusarium avenaceum]|nr:hypothetical protein HG530_005758 [Fusarium avenaceum]
MGMIVHGAGGGEKGYQASEDGLDQERDDENPALLGTEVAMEAREEEGSEGEEGNGGKTSLRRASLGPSFGVVARGIGHDDRDQDISDNTSEELKR